MPKKPLHKTPQQTLRGMITRGQAMCEQYQESKIRTREYLRRVLIYLYGVLWEIARLDTLRTEFHSLARARGLRETNDALSLIKLTYCAKLPPLGSQERKNELTKASIYASLLSRAFAEGVAPSDFPDFLQREKIRSRPKRTLDEEWPLPHAATPRQPRHQRPKRFPKFQRVVDLNPGSPREVRLEFATGDVYRAYCKAMGSSAHCANCTIREIGGKPTVVGVRESPTVKLRPFPYRLDASGKWVHRAAEL